jgi:dTDP-4-dehydrorhamnose reductase
MKILLLGKNGQVGWELQRALAPLGELIALDRQGESGLSGDLSNLAKLEQSILSIKPDIIVNAAAYTAVDKAESDTELADVINHKAPALLAKLANKFGALLVHYSTDYVFNGSGEKPWAEDDQTAPLSIYGQTKLDGELAIQQSGCKHLIFRTSWVYAAKGNNFAKTMLRLASDRDELNVISDQIGAPTSAELIADISAHAIMQTRQETAINGLFHLAASGEASWHEYAIYAIEVARNQGASLQVKRINEIPTSEYPTPAARPLNSRLNCCKLVHTFSLCLPHWKTGVERMIQETQGS